MGIPPIKPYPMPTEKQLPANIPQWAVDSDRVVLLIHDMQRYFVRAFPADEAPGKPLVANISLLRDHCNELGIPVAYTAQPGDMTPEQRGLLKDFWGPGMRMEPNDQKVVEPLTPGADDWTFTKWRYSAFFRSDLLERMRLHGRDQILLCGVYAHVGVLMTGVEAFTNDVETFFIADAVADFSQEFHQMAVDYAAQRCAMVGTTQWVVGQLDGAERLSKTNARSTVL